MSNLVKQKGITTAVTLEADTAYTAGSVIVYTGTGADGALADVDGSLSQKVGILLADIDTTTEGRAAVVAQGEFNLDKIEFSGTQTDATIGGALQSLGIVLKTFNK